MNKIAMNKALAGMLAYGIMPEDLLSPVKNKLIAKDPEELTRRVAAAERKRKRRLKRNRRLNRGIS